MPHFRTIRTRRPLLPARMACYSLQTLCSGLEPDTVTLMPMESASFLDCLEICANSPELVAEFNRLTGRSAFRGESLTPIERAVDLATGHRPPREAGENEDELAFVSFVYESVWLRLSRVDPQARARG